MVFEAERERERVTLVIALLNCSFQLCPYNVSHIFRTFAGKKDSLSASAFPLTKSLVQTRSVEIDLQSYCRFELFLGSACHAENRESWLEKKSNIFVGNASGCNVRERDAAISQPLVRTPKHTAFEMDGELSIFLRFG